MIRSPFSSPVIENLIKKFHISWTSFKRSPVLNKSLSFDPKVISLYWFDYIFQGRFFQLFYWFFSVIFLWKLFSESCLTWSEQVKKDHFERGCRSGFSLFSIDFQLYYILKSYLIFIQLLIVVFLFYRLLLSNGSLLISTVHSGGQRTDSGHYQCTATVPELGTLVSRKAYLHLARKYKSLRRY